MDVLPYATSPPAAPLVYYEKIKPKCYHILYYDVT